MSLGQNSVTKREPPVLREGFFYIFLSRLMQGYLSKKRIYIPYHILKVHRHIPISEKELIHIYGSMAYFNFSDPEGNTLMVSRNTATAEANALNPADCVSPILPRIGGVFVDVTDMKSAVQWYTELFNLPYDDKDTDPPIYSIPMTNGPVLLLDQHRSWRQENFTELFYFETDDIEAAYQYVLDQGFKVTGEPNDFEDLAEFAVIDPDGNRIIIACMK